MHHDVAVVRMRGELGASVLHAYLSDIWWHARAGSVVDLAELAFIDCACLGVLVRHCERIRRQGGTFALAGPRPAVRAVLAATGLLTWFEVYDTVKEAVADAGTQRSPGLPCEPGPAADQARDHRWRARRRSSGHGVDTLPEAVSPT
jgi:anti-anti-sigma factor